MEYRRSTEQALQQKSELNHDCVTSRLAFYADHTHSIDIQLNRYYDAVTKDTRDAFERGTAL